MLLYKRVISSACGKDVLFLPVEETLEHEATAVEFRVEAAQWGDVDLPLHVEHCQVFVDRGEMSKDRRASVCIAAAAEYVKDALECFVGHVCHQSATIAS